MSDALKRTEIVAPHEAVKKKELIGRMRKMPGLIVWELEVAKLRFTQAKIEGRIQPDGSVKSEVIMKPGFLYCQALNRKNAERKFAKMLHLKKSNG